MLFLLAYILYCKLNQPVHHDFFEQFLHIFITKQMTIFLFSMLKGWQKNEYLTLYEVENADIFKLDLLR